MCFDGDTFGESSRYDWAVRALSGIVPNMRNEHTVHSMKCTCPDDAKRYRKKKERLALVWMAALCASV